MSDPAVEKKPRRAGLGLLPIPKVFLEIYVQEKFFLALIGLGFLAVGMTYENASIARWLGFSLAAYAAVANDSIQTIGTFIASNQQKPWWWLWLFIGGLFLATTFYSFHTYGGDVSYERLSAKGFSETPMDFSYLQVAAPLFLLILTRLKMPVSTTFLLLTSFSTSTSGVSKVLWKSVSGYFLAFGLAFVVWILLSRLFDRWFKGDAHPLWRIGQWATTGSLWCVWMMQDAANIAVYLPRKMSFVEYGGFAAVIFFGLGLLFRSGGERIQEIVTEKKNVIDVRSATIIDAVYSVILFYFKLHSKVPMSTTWVFIGLLAGREIAIQLRVGEAGGWRAAVRLMFKDVLLVTIGLIVSLVLAASVNDTFREAILGG